MKDKRSIIDQRIKESKMQVTELIKRLGLKRGNFYLKLNDPNISKDFIAEIGHVINWDFSKDFPEMRGFHYYYKDRLFVLGEPEEAYQRKHEYARFDELQQRIEKQDERFDEWQQRIEKKDALIESQNKIIAGMEKKMKHMATQQKVTNDTLKKLLKAIN
jgi:hypothetical protein